MDLSSLTPDKQVKLQYWLDVIRRCRASGLTNQIWCEQHDISLKSYYYWLSKIRKLALEELPRKKNGIHICTDQQSVALTESSSEFAELSLPDRSISRSTPAAILPALTEGLADLQSQYETFHGTIAQLVNGLGNMTGNLSKLASGINTLVENYETLDSGIGAYTDGVAQIVAGYSQVMGGVSSLAEGSKELLSGSGALYDGTAELYDGVAALCDGARQMADGTGEFRAETADMDGKIDEEINTLLESIGGNMENPVSFVSPKNTNVDSVQFVIQTEAIETEEPEEMEEVTEEKPSLWQKFLNLFD